MRQRYGCQSGVLGYGSGHGCGTGDNQEATAEATSRARAGLVGEALEGAARVCKGSLLTVRLVLTRCCYIVGQRVNNAASQHH